MADSLSIAPDGTWFVLRHSFSLLNLHHRSGHDIIQLWISLDEISLSLLQSEQEANNY